MNKADFINAVAEKANQKRKDVETTVNAFWDVVTETLANGDTLTFVGTASFGVKQRAARTGQNPKTGEKLTIPAATVPYFRAGNKLKNAVAQPKK